MRSFVRLTELTSWILSVVAGIGAVMAMAMITIDVLLRLFGTALPGTYEMVVNYAMLLIAFLPLMRVEWLDQMITVEVVYTLAPRSVRLALLLFAAFVTVLVYLALAWSTWHEARQAMSVGSYVITMGRVIPIWPAYFVLPLAFMLGAAAVLLRGIQRATGQIDVDELAFDPQEEGRKLAEASTGHRSEQP